jgi:hypothetical protein
MESPGEVRRDVTEYGDYAITVATERMNDGAWAVVARAVHRTPTADEVFPVPVPEERFPTEEQARQFGVEVAQRWIDKNAPPAG